MLTGVDQMKVFDGLDHKNTAYLRYCDFNH